MIPPISDLDPSVRPSQIQLDDGDVCSARTHGATTLRSTYICHPPNGTADDETKSTIGEVDKSGAVWIIQQVDGVSSVDEIPDKNNPPTRTAQIVKAWMNG
ncbi:MAG TPA: hypothetical protein VIM19_08640 [Actinomycetes bacterium]